MKLTVLYTGNDKKSHFRETEIECMDHRALGNYSKSHPVKHLFFRDSKICSNFNWHNAPQQQYIIYLAGEVEIEVGSGEKRIFKSGDILLATDLDGEGHITRVLSESSAVIVSLDHQGLSPR